MSILFPLTMILTACQPPPPPVPGQIERTGASATGHRSTWAPSPARSKVRRGQVVLATSTKVRVAGHKSRRITFARGDLVVAGKAKRVVRVRLSSANRKLVAKLRRVRVTVTLTPQGGKPLNPGVTVLLPPRR